MVSKEELQKVRDELVDITGFLTDYLPPKYTKSDEHLVTFASHVSDAISWFLGDIPTENFMSELMLNIDRLRELVRMSEEDANVTMKDYVAMSTSSADDVKIVSFRETIREDRVNPNKGMKSPMDIKAKGVVWFA